MRILKFNDIIIDTDESTAIGVDIQTYDFKDAGKNKISVSNTFSIPYTANNARATGFVGDLNSISTSIYDELIFDYWIDNEYLIKKAKVRIESIVCKDNKKRINCFIYQKQNFWDELKLLKWRDFITEYLVYLQTQRGLYYKENKFKGTYSEFISKYIFANRALEKDLPSSSPITLPLYYSNLYRAEIVGGDFLEKDTEIWLKLWSQSGATPHHGGHFCIFIKNIFEWIEYKYDVSFLMTTGIEAYNAFDYEDISKQFIPARDIELKYEKIGDDEYFWFQVRTDGTFTPDKDLLDKPNCTVNDLIVSFLQMNNLIKDEIFLNKKVGNNLYSADKIHIKLSRFDDLLNAEIIDWSKNVTGDYTYKPAIAGFSQANVIKFKKVFSGGDADSGAKIINCLNKNLDARTDMFSINAYFPTSIHNDLVGNITDLTKAEAFDTFTFFMVGGLTTSEITVKFSDNFDNPKTVSSLMYKAEPITIDSQYNYYSKIIERPKFYEINKWLSVNDVYNLQFFKRYYIKSLGGVFYLNKISGFNYEKSNQPTKIELIKLGDEMPFKLEGLNLIIDGLSVLQKDGDGSYLY